MPHKGCVRNVLCKPVCQSHTVDHVTRDLNEVAQTDSYIVGPGSPKRSPNSKADLPESGQEFGNFRLIRKLGEGGMGAVFEAEDLDAGRRVALKLLTHSLESPEARNRFFREGRLAASINHPNSVYVFGTAEIDGTPAISMEYVSAGTLQDRVRRQGPLPAGEAVDVILQIIAGLEAAEKVGVLHRDVKPSNCFVDAYGTVKIGDFGLSISTEVRGDSQLTAPGLFLGTPAFSSPEQLRGDQLDVRSDIYAVGVTLYYLLTGRMPFEAEDLVKLLATVLEQPARPPAELRGDIPKGLSKVVLRCLTKQPGERFTNYADLRDALVPYDSNAPTPATLALRGLAGICDLFIWSIAIVALQIAWFGHFAAMTDPAMLLSREYIVVNTVVVLLYICYFAIPEGLWGASLGKAICRLRVVDRNRNSIGVPRAFIRTLIYFVFPNLAIWIYWLCGGAGPLDFEKAMSDPENYRVMTVLSYSYYVMLALLFVSARRRNGYSGLHDLATKARVILRPAYVGRPSVHFTESLLPDLQEKRTIGPYHVLDSLQKSESAEFLLAYDTRLLRRIWVRRLPDGSPAIAAKLRDLGRVGRLRWINGRRTAGECWDAYEALSGKPLLKLLDEPQPWAVVRYWLMDLSDEISISVQDGTLPKTLALDRVWITSEGRAKLLDFPAPGTNSSWVASADDRADERTTTAQQFLFHVSASALQGRVTAQTETRLNEAAVEIPVGARSLIDRLAREHTTAAKAAAEFRTLTSGTPSVTRGRRAAMVMTMASVPIFVGVISALGWMVMSQWNEQNPEMNRLRNCLIYMDATLDRRSTNAMNNDEKDPVEQKRRAFAVYISGEFSEVIQDKKKWNGLYGRTIPPPLRAKAQQFVAEHPEPTDRELRDAAEVVEPMLNDFEKSVTDMSRRFSPLTVGLFQFTLVWIMFVMVPSMAAAVAFRRGPVMRMFGVDYVIRSGTPAPRLRMLCRSVLFNSPWVLSLLTLAFGFPSERELTIWLPPIFGLAFALTILSLMLPLRGIPDRFSGTFPVPS